MLVKYGKVGPLKFASHRDFARVLERGLRRAEIPMAYSSGFNPHQRISYINPAPTGVGSVAEYCVVALSEEVDPADVQQRLQDAMPTDMPIYEVTELVGQPCFEASEFMARLDGIDLLPLQQAVEALLAKEEALVSRETKSGLRTFNARPAIESLTVTEPHTLRMVVRHTEPLVRAEDVCQALGLTLPHPPAVTRSRQGKLSDLL